MENDHPLKEQDIQRETAKTAIDFLYRTIIHHGLWFAEVWHQLGEEKALHLLAEASEKSFSIQMSHLARLFGFEMIDGIPGPLLKLEPEVLEAFKDRLAKNWLANDGVWFQTVENAEGMGEAKRCNDSCWGRFSPFEAQTIKKRLNLPEKAGLEGLKLALAARLYATVNVQSIVDEKETGFVFQMNRCRVQDARKRKGLADYPCASGGLVEYSRFAATIDSRIKTRCVGCPPGQHPDEWYCAWEFTLE